jgi:signal transduction histidine kinase
MNYAIRTLLCLMCLLPVFQVRAGRVDSLKKELLHASDTNTVKVLNDLTLAYRSIQPDSAIFYGELAAQVARRNSFVRGEAQAYSNLGSVYFDRQDYKEALSLYEQAVDIKTGLRDSLGLASLFNKIGLLYQRRNMFEEALTYQEKALSIYASRQMELQVAASHNDIAVLLKNTHQYKRALNEHYNALRLRIKLNDVDGLSDSYGNIAAVYKQLNEIDSAEYFSLLSVDMARLSGERDFLGESLNSLSGYKSDKGAYAEAYKLAEESFEIRSAANDKRGMMASLANMARARMGTGDVGQAIAYLRRAEELSSSINAIIELESIYPLLAKAYEEQGSFQQALRYHKLYKQVTDSLFNEDLNTRITEMQLRYQTAQKEQQIALLSKDNLLKEERNKRQRNIFIATLVILVVGGGSYYNYFRSQKKKELYTTLLKEKEAYSRAVIEAEGEERQRIAKELHDGVGQMLTAARMNLEALQSVLDPSDMESRDLYYKAYTLLRDSSTEVRSVSHNMMPELLVKMGLVPAVKDLVRKVNGNKLQVELHVTGLEGRLEPGKEAVIYRVLQELLGNILKHAEAKHAGVQLIQDGNQLTLMVEDDGVGFDIDKHNENPGVGMKSIASRVDYLKGQVYWDSQPGRGTTVTIEVPL